MIQEAAILKRWLNRKCCRPMLLLGISGKIHRIWSSSFSVKSVQYGKTHGTRTHNFVVGGKGNTSATVSDFRPLYSWNNFTTFTWLYYRLSYFVRWLFSLYPRLQVLTLMNLLGENNNKLKWKTWRGTKQSLKHVEKRCKEMSLFHFLAEQYAV